MYFRRIALVTALAAVLVSPLVAAAAEAPAAPKEAAGKYDKLIKYYRKKANLAPQVPVSVKDVKDSPIPGAKQGVLQIGTPPRSKDVTFTASPDGRYVVFGEIDDITIDPAKAVMAKISLEGEPFKGPADAPVTIVEYSDFQCPFCARGYNTIEKQVLPSYKGKVRFFYKHLPLPFHPWAESAAIAYECVKKQDPSAAWEVYSGFFENQKSITKATVKDKVLEFLDGAQIDRDAFAKCYDQRETAAKVRQDRAEAASLGISGTPSFVINGRMVRGAQPAAKFKAIIDDELASAGA